MARICFFGDSITWGGNDTHRGGWVNRLRVAVMNSRYPEVNVLFNCGIDGNRLLDVLRRFPAEASARQADHLVFAVGINDSLHNGVETPLDAFENQYEEMVVTARLLTARVTIVGCTNVAERPTLSYLNEHIKPYNEIIAQAAKRHNLPFVDPFGSLDEDDLRGDGIHPEPSGHLKLAKMIAPHVLDTLPVELD